MTVIPEGVDYVPADVNERDHITSEHEIIVEIQEFMNDYKQSGKNVTDIFQPDTATIERGQNNSPTLLGSITEHDLSAGGCGGVIYNPEQLDVPSQTTEVLDTLGGIVHGDFPTQTPGIGADTNGQSTRLPDLTAEHGDILVGGCGGVIYNPESIDIPAQPLDVQDILETIKQGSPCLNCSDANDIPEQAESNARDTNVDVSTRGMPW